MDKEAIERRIVKSRVSLLFDCPFFGDIAMHLKISENKEIPTMAVDSYGNLYYNPDFINRLSDRQLVYVICHETLHCSLGQMLRVGYRDKFLWNIAMDYVSNIIIDDAHIGERPPGALYDVKFRGMTTEQVYSELLKSAKKVKKSVGKDDKSGVGEDIGGNKDTIDKHIYKPLTSSETKDIENEWKQRVASASTVARQRGKLPSNLETLINEILKPIVDWRILLQQFMIRCTRDDYTWNRPSRRHVSNGLYLPSITGESTEIAIGLDTSGSISDAELKQFLAEVQAILNLNSNMVIHLYQCDADIHSYKEYRSGDTLDYKITGRGGTSFVPVFKDIDDKGITPVCLVYLTDGEGEYPKKPPEYPVLWVLVKNYNVPWGEKVIMNLNGR